MTGVVAIGDFLPAADQVGGELQILGEEEVVPPAQLFQQAVGKEEPGAGHGAAGAQVIPGAVQVLALPQKPQAIPGGDPVVAVIFGVAVAGDHPVARGEHLVHLGYVAGVQQVVGVKDKVAVVVLLGVLLLDFLQQKPQREALAHLQLILALENPGPAGRGDLRGVVGAVVRHHVNVDQILGVILPPDALQQLGDDALSFRAAMSTA